MKQESSMKKGGKPKKKKKKEKLSREEGESSVSLPGFLFVSVENGLFLDGEKIKTRFRLSPEETTSITKPSRNSRIDW